MRKKGFTLIELLAVIIILAVIALIATPIVLNVIEDARKTAAFSEANYIYSGIKSYCQNEDALFELNPNRTEERICNNGLDEDDIRVIIPNLDDDTIVTDVLYEDNELTNIQIIMDNITFELDEDGNLIDKATNYFVIDNVLTSNYVKNNNNGTLIVARIPSSTGVVALAPNTLKNYAPNLEVGKTYKLTANTTGLYKKIYLQGTKFMWSFDSTRTITEEDLNSIVYWYANDTMDSATISNIKIEEVK